MSEVSDETIIQITKDGHSEAFTELIHRYGTLVYRTCYRFAGSDSEADDLTQEVFLHAFKSIKSFKNESSFSTWLYTIAVRRGMNYIRWKKSKRIDVTDTFTKENKNGEAISNEPVAYNDNVESSVQKKHMSAIIQKHLLKLSPKQRIVVILKIFENRPYEEIAGHCNCSVGTVGSRLTRALNELREFIKRDSGETNEL